MTPEGGEEGVVTLVPAACGGPAGAQSFFFPPQSFPLIHTA